MNQAVPSLPRRLLQRAWLSRVAAIRGGLVRPDDTPQATVAGRHPLRVLLIGSGPVSGWGVSSHELGLPGALARALAAETGRGAVVDVVAEPAAGVRRLRSLTRRAGPARFDVVVLSGAVADAVRVPEPAHWGRRLRALLVAVRGEGAETLVWLGAQPIRAVQPSGEASGRVVREHALRLNAVAEEVCRAEGVLYVPLDAPPHADDARHRSPADYLFWARQITDALAPRLEGPETGEAPGELPAGDRVDAINRLRLEEHIGDARLEGIVVTARRTLGADIAVFTVLDAEHEWPIASSGASIAELPIDQSVCRHTIAAAEGLFIADATRDDRFATHALVTGPAHLRFYAGYPVEAPDGTRIGALCVLGRTPRDAGETDADLDVLRELALLAQRELWRWEPRGV